MYSAHAQWYLRTARRIRYSKRWAPLIRSHRVLARKRTFSLNVLLSPRHAPRDTHELSMVLAALDSTDGRERKPSSYLSEVGDLLRPRLDALNEGFSEPRYAEFRERLATERATVRLLARQAEWPLNIKQGN
jgi:hypothetical protein